MLPNESGLGKAIHALLHKICGVLEKALCKRSMAFAAHGPAGWPVSTNQSHVSMPRDLDAQRSRIGAREIACLRARWEKAQVASTAMLTYA